MYWLLRVVMIFMGADEKFRGKLGELSKKIVHI